MSKMSLFPEWSNKLDAETFCVILDDLDLTHAALAHRLGLDRKTVSRWANGDVAIPGPVAILMQVAHAMLDMTHVWRGEGFGVDDAPAVKRLIRSAAIP